MATLALAIAEAAVILVLVVVLIIMCCRKKATVAPETPKRASAEDDGPYLHDEDPAYHAHDQDSDGEDGAPSKKAKGSSKQAKAAAAAAAARRSYERTKLRPSERLGREELLLVMRDPAMYAVLRKRDAAWETWESGTARAASAAEGAQPMKPLVADTGRTIDVTAGHLFMRNISVRNTGLYQPAALRPPPEECDEWQSGCATPLANGDYAVEASYVGIGARMFLGE